MAVTHKNKISYEFALIVLVFCIVAIAIVVKLINLQFVQGSYYKNIAKQRTVKNFEIPANKGNIYSSDGSLLATSIPEYTLRFDSQAPSEENFEKNLPSLCDSLQKFVGKKSASQWENDFRKARATKNRYMLIASKKSYTEYVKIKSFPLFKMPSYKGGLIVEQDVVRKFPVGQIAKRTIGYEKGKENGKGLEFAFRDFILGKSGHRLMQRIAKNQWKPIRDVNELDPQDGYDIVSTIDVYIQDIAHHALLKQLEHYSADHGCVVVMETKTGEVKAIANLGKADDGTYYESQNYAVAESHEPGSTFKLLDLIALLDDKKVDTSQVYNTHGGIISINNRKVRDSHEGGYGMISLGRGFEVSSNTVMVQAVYQNYLKNPEQFVNRINSYGLNKKLGIQLKGEGIPKIPQPVDKTWNKTSLPWMAFGYGVSVTPLQTLTMYNAVANNGKMIKPIFVKEVKEWNKTIKSFKTEVINPQICSNESLLKVRKVLENVVKKGTAKSLYSKDFSMAGKTGTAQVDYHKGKGELYYASSFVGYFPANQPKYSCIVVVHKPNVSAGYFGADVAGPVFKRIAQKIFTDVPNTNKFKNINTYNPLLNSRYNEYITQNQFSEMKMPNLKGFPAMDALSLLENLGLKVKLVGKGKVKSQSIDVGQNYKKNQTIILELS